MAKPHVMLPTCGTFHLGTQEGKARAGVTLDPRRHHHRLQPTCGGNSGRAFPKQGPPGAGPPASWGSSENSHLLGTPMVPGPVCSKVHEEKLFNRGWCHDPPVPNQQVGGPGADSRSDRHI